MVVGNLEETIFRQAPMDIGIQHKRASEHETLRTKVAVQNNPYQTSQYQQQKIPTEKLQPKYYFSK